MNDKIMEFQVLWDTAPATGGSGRKLFTDVFCRNSMYTKRGVMKRMLTKHGILSNQCSSCGVVDWMGSPIVLHLDHIDGDRHNNEINNLRLLCPNCHSMTHTYAGRNKKVCYKTQSHSGMRSDNEFIDAIESSPNARQALIKLGLQCFGGNYDRVRKVKAANDIEFNRIKTSRKPSFDELIIQLSQKNIVEIGELYSVSDNAIRKWMRSYGIPTNRVDLIIFIEKHGLSYMVSGRWNPNPPRGSMQMNSKLSESDVLNIRMRNASGDSIHRIANDYPVSVSTIKSIINRLSWTHI